jgi:hypothetical protein
MKLAMFCVNYVHFKISENARNELISSVIMNYRSMNCDYTSVINFKSMSFVGKHLFSSFQSKVCSTFSFQFLKEF